MPTKVERLVAVVIRAHERWRRWMSHPVLRAAVFVFVIVASVLVVVHPTLAAADVKNPGILDRLMLLVAGMALGIAQILGMLVVAILDFIIPLMTYQNIVNSPVVNAGWAIVRDTVNMFFVIVLIVIAVGTIFGSQRFHWEQQVPRLLGFAILINFSKTLCGIMIDFGQIIMLTFANALKDIAAGNFIQLLGLNDFMSISEQAGPIKAAFSTGETSIVPFDYLAASIAAVLMLTIVLSTLIILGAILAFRIVMLWVLVTLAPLAWFIGGAKDVVRSNAYSEWWTNFTCYVAIGPVLTFFLWLTLAVAGSGSIAASAGFTAGVPSPGASPSGLLSTIFQFEKLTSFVIGIAMLYAGFDAAQKVCNGAQGIASSAIGAARGAGRGMARRAAGLGAYAGAKGARWGVAGTRKLAGKAYGAGAASLAGSDLVQSSPFLRQFTDRGKHENLNKKIEDAKDPKKKLDLMRQRDALEKTLSEQGKGLTEEFKGDTMDTKTGYLNSIGERLKDGEKLKPADKKKAGALLGELLGDAKAVEALNKGGSMNELFTALGDEASLTSKDHVKAFKKSRPDFAVKKKDDGKWDFSAVKEMDDVKNLNLKDLDKWEKSKRDALIEQLKTIPTGNKDKEGQSLSAFDDLREGRLGSEAGKKYKGLYKPDAKELLPKYNEAAGKFADPVDGRLFTDALMDDLGQLEHVSEEMLTGSEGRNDLSQSVAAAANNKNVGALFKEYEKADEAGRTRIKDVLNKLKIVADQQVASAWDEKEKSKYANMSNHITKTLPRIEAIAARSAPPTAEERTSIKGSIRSDVTKLDGLRGRIPSLERDIERAKDELFKAERGQTTFTTTDAEAKAARDAVDRAQKAIAEEREAIVQLEKEIEGKERRLT